MGPQRPTWMQERDADRRETLDALSETDNDFLPYSGWTRLFAYVQKIMSEGRGGAPPSQKNT